jgi:tryptophan synthase alpha subunit
MREKINRVKASGKEEVFVGFGIKDRQDVKLACEVADGAIIGTKAVMELKAGIDQFRWYIAELQ